MSEKPKVIDQLEAAANVVPPDVAAARLALSNVGVEIINVTDKYTYLSRVAELSHSIAESVKGDEKIEFSTVSTSYITLAQAFGGNTEKAPTQTNAKKLTGKKQNPAT